MILNYAVNVPHKSFVLCPLNGAALEQAAVLLDGQTEPVGTGHAQKFLVGLQLRVVGRRGEAVPWASVKATVATVDGVAHAGSDV